MSLPSPRVRVAVVAVLLGLAGCSSPTETPTADPSTPSSSPPSTTAAPAVVPKAPEEGACYRLGLDQLAKPTNRSKPVACTGEHTAQTIHVGRLKTVVDGHALAVDSDAVQEQLATTCPQALADYVGGTEQERALSRLEVVWFSPTLGQADRGANWFRCDVVGFGTGNTLLDLPPSAGLEQALDQPEGRDRFGLCGTAEPGEEDFVRVVCARPHTWRAIATIPMGTTKYPGVDVARDFGDDACRTRVREREGFTLTLRYGWEWPTAAQWRAGQRYGYCWAPEG